MKQLCKMMLVAVASVALAAPAFAWDFSASGTAGATFNVTSTKATKDAANAWTGGSGISSEGSGLTLASSNTDGANTVSFSYGLDWDGNLDQTMTVSGSSTVGEWTASGSVSHNLQSNGCSSHVSNAVELDNSTIYAGADNGTLSSQACAGAQTTDDRTAVTLTNGTLTIVLGESSHLSGQNVSAGSTAGGSVELDGAFAEASVGAVVGGFHGVSVGYAISDTMSVTGAYQATGDQNDLCGALDMQDGEAAGLQHSTTGTGFAFNGTFGTIGVGATMCSASTADGGTAAGVAGGSTGTSSSTLGVGVTMDLGDIDPFLSFGSYAAVGASTKSGKAGVGNELGLTYALGDDTVILYYGSVSEISTSTGTAADAVTVNGMELGYNTAVGPASLSLGYGTQSTVNGASDGRAYSDIEVALSYSF